MRRQRPPDQSLLVAVSGVDGAGKGYVAIRLAAMLESAGLHAIHLGVDGWLNLPRIRFNAARPAVHFYQHAIRFESMFEQLVLPLRRRRSIEVETEYTEETATAYRRRTWRAEAVDVIVLEGIYLLKRAWRRCYDWSLWVECSFETALERAVTRAQEGLRPEETIHAYRTIYFPAQEIHFRLDDPRATADAVLLNDPRLGRAA